jgi:hypothetical protein
MPFWEDIAYGIARGVVRAYFDELDERQLAVEEVPSLEDRVRARRFRDAVGRVRDLPAGGDPKLPGPAPGGGGGASRDGLVPPP